MFCLGRDVPGIPLIKEGYCVVRLGGRRPPEAVALHRLHHCENLGHLQHQVASICRIIAFCSSTFPIPGYCPICWRCCSDPRFLGHWWTRSCRCCLPVGRRHVRDRLHGCPHLCLCCMWRVGLGRSLPFLCPGHGWRGVLPASAPEPGLPRCRPSSRSPRRCPSWRRASAT